MSDIENIGKLISKIVMYEMYFQKLSFDNSLMYICLVSRPKVVLNKLYHEIIKYDNLIIYSYNTKVTSLPTRSL